jgi:uncharacterized RDD family membrane protein YckC
MYIRVQTAQYVPIEYEAASAGERILAFALDLAAQIAYVFLSLKLTDSMRVYDYTFTFVLVVIPTVSYSLIWETLFNGQTPGKMAMKIRVVKLDGSSPGFSAYFMRWIIGWPENWLFFGIPSLIASSASPYGQRLGDMAAGTSVIRLRYRVKFEHTLFREADEEYRPRYPAAARLSDKDAAIINELLNSPHGAAQSRLLHKAARRIESLYDLQAQEPSDYDFLNRLILDYNHFTGNDSLCS